MSAQCRPRVCMGSSLGVKASRDLHANMARVRSPSPHDVWSKFCFLVEILIFGRNFDFWSKFLFLVEILIFGRNFDVWSKFCFLVEILIFGRNFDFWWKFWSLVELLIFGRNFIFWSKFWFWLELLICGRNFMTLTYMGLRVKSGFYSKVTNLTQIRFNNGE